MKHFYIWNKLERYEITNGNRRDWFIRLKVGLGKLWWGPSGGGRGVMKQEICNAIWWFKPKTFRDVISLARVKDKQINHIRKMAKSPKTVTKFHKEKLKQHQTFKIIHRMSFSKEKLLDNASIIKMNSFMLTAPAEGWWHEPYKKHTVHAHQVGNQEMVALNDSGSTHNFVNNKASSKFKLNLEPINAFQDNIANGTSFISVNNSWTWCELARYKACNHFRLCH